MAVQVAVVDPLPLFRGGAVAALAAAGHAVHTPSDVVALWVPRTSSTSGDQAVFVDHAADARVSSDTVLLKIDRFG